MEDKRWVRADPFLIGKVNDIVEADIKSSFDKVNHEWMVKFLQHRIGDDRLIRLIIRMLKSGIMEDGLTRSTEAGTPQGSILSPLLSNIYLHYVLEAKGRNDQIGPHPRGRASERLRHNG